MLNRDEEAKGWVQINNDTTGGKQKSDAPIRKEFSINKGHVG